MRAPAKSAALAIALAAMTGLAPGAEARPVAGVAAAEVVSGAAAPRARPAAAVPATPARQGGAPWRAGKPAAAPAAEPQPRSQPGPQPPAAEPEAPAPVPAPLLDAGFENGLDGWNTAGYGEALPALVSDNVRSGSRAARFALSGDQHRSELILGGSGDGSTAEAVRFYEGDEYWYGFSFYIESMVYGRPGAHNLIMQFKSADSGSPAFGLALWDYRGDRGLYSHGSGMGGDRFLAAAAERQWHDVVIHFKASSAGGGFYRVYLDGALVDSRDGTSMIVAGSPNAYVKAGLYRNGGAIPGTSELRLDAARLGSSLAAVSG